MLTLTTKAVIRSMTAAHVPAAKAHSGENVKFITLDAMGNQYVGQPSYEINEDLVGNPATGPLYIEEANPGDTLKVTILDVILPSSANMTIAPGVGVFADEVQTLQRRVFSLSNGNMLFNNKLHLPLKPMIGFIGVAPDSGELPNSYPGSHGGNMDNKRIEPGTVIYLPVYHKGALLAIGDVHALMGDGEVSICAAEAEAEVTIRVDVIKRSYDTILVVGHGRVMTVNTAGTLEVAGFEAAKAMRRFLKVELGMDDFESCSILSLVGDMCICQVVDPLMTCRMEVPLSIFDAYGYTFE
ncbi:MAG TPA: acetamidase/formamidase family protein [Desulfuromonadaceae bacterium]